MATSKAGKKLQELLDAIAATGKAKVELTDSALGALRDHLRDNPAARPAAARRIWDTRQSGLFLRVMPTGTMSFGVQWSRKGTKSLGQYPTKTLDGVRKRTKRVLADASTAADGIPEIAKPAPVSEKLTLADFVDKHYRPHARATMTHGDLSADRILRVLSKYRNKPLAALTHAAIQQVLNRRQVSAATKARDRNTLRAAFSLAVKWEMLEANPATGLDLGKAEDDGDPRYLSAEEEVALLSALAERDQALRDARARTLAGGRKQHASLAPIAAHEYPDHLTPLVVTALHTGCRRGELFKLRWANVTLSGMPRITLAANTTKSKKTRHIPLNATAVTVLKQWRKQNPRAVKVFGLVDVKKAWARVLESAGVEDFRFHDLRHTFASKLVQRGVDLNTVRDLLGHADIKMTLRYAHLAPENMAAAVALLERPAGDSNVIQFPAKAG